MERRRSLHLASHALREQRRLRKEGRGDSPEKRAERHVPKPDIVDVMHKASGGDLMVRGGGADSKSRFPER